MSDRLATSAVLRRRALSARNVFNKFEASTPNARPAARMPPCLSTVCFGSLSLRSQSSCLADRVSQSPSSAAAITWCGTRVGGLLLALDLRQRPAIDAHRLRHFGLTECLDGIVGTEIYSPPTRGRSHTQSARRLRGPGNIPPPNDPLACRSFLPRSRYQATTILLPRKCDTNSLRR